MYFNYFIAAIKYKSDSQELEAWENRELLQGHLSQYAIPRVSVLSGLSGCDSLIETLCKITRNKYCGWDGCLTVLTQTSYKTCHDNDQISRAFDAIYKVQVKLLWSGLISCWSRDQPTWAVHRRVHMWLIACRWSLAELFPCISQQRESPWKDNTTIWGKEPTRCSRARRPQWPNYNYSYVPVVYSPCLRTKIFSTAR